MRPNKQNWKKCNTSYWGKYPSRETSIRVKVYISLKRLLIVTFNIMAVKIQSSKCSDPVKPLLVGSEASFLSINRTCDFAKTFLWNFFVTTLSCSNITVIVFPSTSKIVGGITYILPTQVNQTLMLQSKLWFILYIF